MAKWILILLIPMLLAQTEGDEPIAEASAEGSEIQEEPVDPGPWEEITMPYVKQNLMVPREVWKTINEILEADKIKEDILNNYAIYPATMSVEIVPEDVGVTKREKHFKVTFPEGGGELDLFKYVDGKGKFNIRLSPHMIDGEKFHLLYISDSPGRVYGDTKWGNGCGNIYDLSQKAEKFVSDKGMLVTTSKRHYLHLMAGYYIAFQMIAEKSSMLLGYVRVWDSRYPQFSCSIE